MCLPASLHLFALICLLATAWQSVNGQEACITPSFENGLCVPYTECAFVHDVAQKYGKNIPKYVNDYIYQSKCSRDDEPTIRLCCKAAEIPVTMENRLLDTATELNKDGFNILNSLNCGNSNGNRVAGGEETSLAEFPWMALLRYDVVSGDQYLCGGSLITNRFVLTAAHCVYRDVQPLIEIRLGEHDLSKDEDCVQLGPTMLCNPPVEDYGIEKIINHPMYNERRRINDIALIKLDRDVDFKKHIQPVCLPITPSSMQVKDDDGYFIAGWGVTEKSVKSMVLLKAQVAKQERSVCHLAYRIDINEKHLCAADLKTGRDTCRGDSGGPLLHFSKYKKVKKYIQYGVVASGGLACSLEQVLPGIYTNVVHYLPWITEQIATA